MGSKTYTSASISNLNTKGKEFRYERLAMLEAACSTWQHPQYGLHLQKTQLGGQGVGFRNWVYWSREYKYSNYRESSLKKYDKTYNELIKFYEPQVSSSIELSEEQLNNFAQNTLKLPTGVEELSDGTVTVVGVQGEELKEVTITGRVKIVHRFMVINSYSGAYDSVNLGEAYIWKNYTKYLKDSKYIQRYVLSEGEKKAYNVIPGDNYSPEEEIASTYVNAGKHEDIWLQLGYEYEEPHTDENDEEVIELVFNSEENTYIPISTEIPKYKFYFAIWGYSYDLIELDALQYEITEDGYLKLDGAGNPIKKPEIPTPPDEEPKIEWKQLKTPFKFEYEDWEKTVKEEFDTSVVPTSIKGFGYIDSLENAAADPNIGSSINTDMQNLESYMVPMVCFKNDKTWIDDKYGDWWDINTKACKKLTKDSGYYATMFDELQKQISQGDVAYVYIIYGLPCNYAQTHYGNHYALQFFKQLTIPNWSKYKHGDTADVKGKGVHYRYGSNTFNCHFSFSVGNTHYRCGRGKCPAAKSDTVRPGDGKVTDFNGVTFWVQHQTDSWEMITISDYSSWFDWIKNGKGAGTGGADWFRPIWKKENVERQFSGCIIPLMWSVGKNIPFIDWTNLMQFCPNVAATAYKVVKTKWYQTGLFKIILNIIIIVVVVIISIFSAGTASGPAAVAGAAIAGAIGGSTVFWTAVVAVAMSIAVSVAVNAIITPLLKEVFGEVIGSVLGALVTMVVSMYCITGTFDTSAILKELCNPVTWLSMANAALNGMNEIIQKKMKGVQQSANAFRERAEEKHEEILEAESELGLRNTWALQRIYGAATGNALDNCEVGSPDNFLARTLYNWIDSMNNAIYTLENYPQLDIDNHTIPAISFGGSAGNNGLGQTV